MTDERDLLDVIDGEDDLDLGVVEEAVSVAPVRLGTFTDEELHLLADRDDVDPDEFEAPRLGALDHRAQTAALDAVLCVMLARGDLVQVGHDPSAEVAHTTGVPSSHDDGGGALIPVGRYALVDLREDPLAVMRVRQERRDPPSTRLCALYYVTDRLLLLEQVQHVGLHTMRFVSSEHAVSHLRWMLDPNDRVLPVTEAPLFAARRAELQDELDLALAAADEVCVVDVARVGEHDVDHLNVTVYAGEDGVRSFRGSEHQGRSELRLQGLDHRDLDGLATELVMTALRPVHPQGR